MADIQARDVTQHYNLPTAYPEEWPANLDNSDDSDEEILPSENDNNRRHSQARYHKRKDQSNGPGSRSRVAAGNLVQKDEPDPLGGPDSIVKILKKRGISVEDERVRNQFLLSSTTFSPTLFLSQTHQPVSTQSLLQGLDYLSKSIDQKSASLKMLVESNFERFVRVKTTLDSVYTEMGNQGANSREDRKSGSNIGSPNSGLWTSTSNSVSHKTAINKESEYGVQGIRKPLVQASARAEQLWGKALGGREREEGLKVVLDAVEKHRDIYEIGSNLSKSIQQRDYESIFEQYGHARRYTNEAKLIADRAITTRKALGDEQIHMILATGRMWTDVEKQIQTFKRDLWKRLSNAQSTTPTGPMGGQVDEHMELIAALLELGVEDNPVWVWLLSRYDYLKTRITSFCKRSMFEIEVLRRRLAMEDKPNPQSVAPYLQLTPQEKSKVSIDHLDTESVVELWECVFTFLKKLISIQGGFLGDVLTFWESAESFIDGGKQRLLPAGFEGESRKHHRLSASGISDLKDGIVELTNLIRESVISLFADPPPEDIQPLLPQPTGSIASFSNFPSMGSRFKLDLNEVPPVPGKKGEPWEDFSFWPPYSNSLSGVHYLSEFLILIGTSASEMAGLSPLSNGGNAHDKLKLLVSVTRERCVRATCAAWNRDAELCKYLEDWTPDPNNKDLTRMPGHFMAFESAILSGMQKILYISEAMTKPGMSGVVTPPPAKLLQLVRTQFVTSVYKSLSGLVENAEHPVNVDEETEDAEGLLLSPNAITNAPDAPYSIFNSGGVDSKNRNVRVLLTLSNLRALRTDQVPQLVTNFEASFAVKLTDESKTIQDVLGQIDERLFQSYIEPIVENIKSTILGGIGSPDWVPATSRPEQIRPYVYTTMLTLVMVHTEITTTLPAPTATSSASTSLAYAILAELLTQASSSLLEAFTQRPKYSLPALMQATLDTEFIAQTMSQYATDAASKVQSQIYLELDRRTNNEARAKLQAELGEMRGILKRLREATRGEFACFKKPRGGNSK